MFKFIVVLAIIGAAATGIWWISSGEKLGGYTWSETKDQFFPTKKAQEKKRMDYWKQAEEQAEPDTE